MATTAILRSQDCLLRPNNFRSEPMLSPPFKPHTNPNPNPNPKSTRSRSQKQSPVGRNRGQDRALVAKFPAKNLVMGQVKILKRGEELKPGPASAKNKNDRGSGDADLFVCSTDRLGPEPEMVQKQIRVSDLKLYAGSAAFLASPPPSSLPFPAFFSKKKKRRSVMMP